MNNRRLMSHFSELTTPHIADAVIRLGITPRVAPQGIRSLTPGTQLAGRVLPVRHYGSVDVFFEAMLLANSGDVMVIDNGGRKDEGCIGDLTALEARAFGIAGMVVWGCHRDTREMSEMDFAVFSYGACPFGPLRVDQRKAESLTSARFGDIKVERGDLVFADDDGVIFVPAREIERLLQTAKEIKETEQAQARAVYSGQTLHKQFRFDEYLAKQKDNPSYSFRQHLRDIGGAIEE